MRKTWFKFYFFENLRRILKWFHKIHDFTSFFSKINDCTWTKALWVTLFIFRKISFSSFIKHVPPNQQNGGVSTHAYHFVDKTCQLGHVRFFDLGQTSEIHRVEKKITWLNRSSENLRTNSNCNEIKLTPIINSCEFSFLIFNLQISLYLRVKNWIMPDFTAKYSESPLGCIWTDIIM